MVFGNEKRRYEELLFCCEICKHYYFNLPSLVGITVASIRVENVCYFNNCSLREIY